MTITAQTVLPTRSARIVTDKDRVKPPPKVYPAQDYPFKGYHPPQPEGYQQSKSTANTSAIVIDNGREAVFSPWSRTVADLVCITQDPISLRRVGRSTRIRDSSSHLL